MHRGHHTPFDDVGGIEDKERRTREGTTVKREECILFSGAAQGTEAEFGAAAERYGIEEVNFTFAGHSDARTRGIRV